MKSWDYVSWYSAATVIFNHSTWKVKAAWNLEIRFDRFLVELGLLILYVESVSDNDINSKFLYYSWHYSALGLKILVTGRVLAWLTLMGVLGGYILYTCITFIGSHSCYPDLVNLFPSVGCWKLLHTLHVSLNYLCTRIFNHSCHFNQTWFHRF